MCAVGWFDTESEKMQVREGTPAKHANPANSPNPERKISNFSGFSNGAPSSTNSSPPYPNEGGQSKCCYCDHYRDHRCTGGHQVDGTSALRECGDFSFNRAAYQDFYERIAG